MYLRRIKAETDKALKRNKSILLLGPRQVGKTTLLEQNSYDISISLLLEKNRIKYERDPDLLIQEVQAHPKVKKGLTVLIDEIQLVPNLLNAAILDSILPKTV